MPRSRKYRPALCSLLLGLVACALSEPITDAGDAAPSGRDLGEHDAGPFTMDSGAVDGASPMDDGPDGSSPRDGGTAPLTPGERIMNADPETWVWIPMDSMRCADGSTGGFAVNLTDRSRELVLYLQGGGVCHNTLTCNASLIDSVGDDPLRTAIDAGITANRGIFDRGDTTNPFRDANFAVVPHCTGDHHTGDSVRTYGSRTVHHHGFANVARVTERLLATFPDASRVTVSGFSAGGVGITGNYQRIAQSFEAIGAPTPLLVIDAGPFLRRPRLAPSSQADLTEAWNLEETVLEYCHECREEGLHAFYRANARAHPQMRASLICAYDDSVVKLMYTAIGSIVGAAALRDGLLELSERHADLAAMRFFFYPGDRHGALHLASDATPGLWTFLSRQVGGASDWSSVIP